jgi:hypothetical protein
MGSKSVNTQGRRKRGWQRRKMRMRKEKGLRGSQGYAHTARNRVSVVCCVQKGEKESEKEGGGKVENDAAILFICKRKEEAVL